MDMTGSYFFAFHLTDTIGTARKQSSILNNIRFVRSARTEQQGVRQIR